MALTGKSFSDEWCTSANNIQWQWLGKGAAWLGPCQTWQCLHKHCRGPRIKCYWVLTGDKDDSMTSQPNITSRSATCELCVGSKADLDDIHYRSNGS